MNRKISTLLAVFVGQSFISEAHAVPLTKPVQFYAGVSLGFNWIKGQRTDSMLASDPTETLYFSNNLKVRDNTNGQYSAFGGVSFSFPESRFSFGPELHIGRSNGDQTVRSSILDPVTGTSRTLVSSLAPSTYLGAVLKVGYEFLPSYTGYFVLGGEANRYINKITYVPKSNGAVGPDYPLGLFQRARWLKGFLWGFGLEKKLHCFQIGTDIRFIDYGSFNDEQFYSPSKETITSSFKLKNIRLSLRVSYLF